MRKTQITTAISLVLGLAQVPGQAQFETTLELFSMNGLNGYTLNGVSPNDNSGRSVSAAGDVNGDGVDDLIIGAPGSNPGGNSNAGRSYVVFGREKPNFEDGFE